MTIFDVLALIGGLCLFLFGMNVMGDSLERRAGGGLKLLLGKLTGNKFKAFLTGLGVTAVIQSSSATTVMVVGFVKKKDEIIELAKQYKDVLANYDLYATGTTGTLIMGETALPIHRMKSGPKGGDQQIGAMLANGELGLIIFLRDPLTAQPHEPDVSALLRLCDVQTIPLATNASSATIMLESLKNGTFPTVE